MATGAFLNVLKPTGMTSHDVVDQIRRGWSRLQPPGLPRADKKPKVGHLGTLDPDAAGVLPLALGSATRLISHLPLAEKVYVAEITFGLVSDTLDLDGEVSRSGTPPPDLGAAVVSALEKYRGTIMQVPPRVSALRRDGKRGYDRARQGEEFEFEPRPALYHDIRFIACQGDRVRLKIGCGPGTYVRALARDLGQDLGCGALLSALVRAQSGPFRLESAVTLEELSTLPWPLLPWHWPFPHHDRALPGLTGVFVLRVSGRGPALVKVEGGQTPQILYQEGPDPVESRKG